MDDTPIEVIIQRILQREGGIANVGDGMGVTRWGQTPAWLEQFNLPVPLTSDDAATNYATWLRVTKLDAVVTVADVLADIVVDIAVMSSAPKAIKALQAVLGVPVDGVLGPQTLAALAAVDRRKAACGVIAWDVEFQGSLITLDPTRARFAKGWARRMAEHIRQLS